MNKELKIRKFLIYINLIFFFFVFWGFNFIEVRIFFLIEKDV